MRKSRFTDEQIIRALREVEAGRPVGDICRSMEVAEGTFYRWKKRFGDIGVTELRELRQLREENRKLKQLVADSQSGQANPTGGDLKKDLL
jgi:putative transposase